MSFPLKSGNHLSWPSTNWEALYIPQTQKSLKSHSFPSLTRAVLTVPFIKGPSLLFYLVIQCSWWLIYQTPATGPGIGDTAVNKTKDPFT